VGSEALIFFMTKFDAQRAHPGNRRADVSVSEAAVSWAIRV
jgi:hypothetical protein